MGGALGFGLVLLVVLGVVLPFEMWLRDRQDRKWGDAEDDHWRQPRPRMGRRRPEPRFPIHDAPPVPKYKYLIGTNPNNAQVVYMSWAEVKELAAERSMRRDVYVSREDGDGIKRWMWRRRVLLRHWTE